MSPKSSENKKRNSLSLFSLNYAVLLDHLGEEERTNHGPGPAKYLI
jgi:hypothetical protein